jgi:hypothetical protein
VQRTVGNDDEPQRTGQRQCGLQDGAAQGVERVGGRLTQRALVAARQQRVGAACEAFDALSARQLETAEATPVEPPDEAPRIAEAVEQEGGPRVELALHPIHGQGREGGRLPL